MQTDTVGAGGAPRPSEEIYALGDRVATLAAQIAAAQAEFLAVLGQFDEAQGWKTYDGVRSAAHWLSWRAGMDLRTAREHLRVARRLRELPRTAAALSEGRVSYSKARAIARVCTPETEQDMLDIATRAPAAHVERLTRGLRTAARNSAAAGDPSAQEVLAPTSARTAEEGASRVGHVQWRWDEEQGDLVLWGRLPAADGAVLLAALTRTEIERVRTEGDAGPEPDPAHTRSEQADLTAAAPSEVAPALVAMAHWCLAASAAPAAAPAAEVVVLLGPADLGAGLPDTPDVPSVLPLGARIEGGPALTEEAFAEVWCQAGIRTVQATRSAILAYGRRRRRFSPSQLRALHLRDRGCRTPGCGRRRFLHAHHVEYWRNGGPTDLDNAVLLCSACHRSVHEGRLGIVALGDQRFEFRDASGSALDPAPPTWGRADQVLSGSMIEPGRMGGWWAGEPLHPSLATATLLDQWVDRARRSFQEEVTARAA